MADFDPQEHFAEDRIEKLENLRESGVDPYPPRTDRSFPIGTFVDRYEGIDDEREERHTLAGRIHRMNDLGSLCFVDITDSTGTVQLFFTEDGTADFELVDELDQGDFISATGNAMLSNSGELSLNVDEFDVLTKALNHPPSRDGLGTEERIRNRAAAMWNDDLRSNLDTRFELIHELRNFLNQREFVEVETPVLQNIYGGANAEPFTTYCEAIDSEMYLRIATELHLKRMIIGGYDRVYEIGKVFRNEDIDTTHHPEYTSIEIYEKYADYNDMMQLTEDILVHLLDTLNDGEYEVEYDGEMVDFTPPFRRLPMEESIEEFGGITVADLDDDELRQTAEEHGGEFPGGFSRGLAVMELFDEVVEPKITDPVFITDHPEESTPLCKEHPEKDGNIERFELFATGVELTNAYTELNDPIQQGEYFADQVARFEEGDEEAHRMDENFLQALGHGMPPTGGLGIGIARLVMLLTDSQSIKDVLPFPMVSDRES